MPKIYINFLYRFLPLFYSIIINSPKEYFAICTDAGKSVVEKKIVISKLFLDIKTK